LQNHYNYVFDNITNTYNFVTKNNILYRVAFVVDESFSSLSNESVSDMFQLVVEKASEGLEPYDAKVSKTIEDIIERFFRRKENSLIYICSDDNNRSKLRHDVFDRWYRKSRYQQNIIKLDNVIDINVGPEEIQRLYTSLMFHKQNSYYEKIISIYKQLERALNEDK